MACLSARSVHLSTGGWNREIQRSAAGLLQRGLRLFSLRSRKRKKNYPFDDCLLKFAIFPDLFTATLCVLRHVVGLSAHAFRLAELFANVNDVHVTAELL